MSKPRRVTVYTPDSRIRTPGKLIAEMFRDFASSHSLAWRLFVRNLSSQYRQTILGYVWLFLPPLITTAIWVFLNSQKVIDIGETPVPYAVYVLTGSILWQGFELALRMPLQGIQRDKAILTKINFPREALLTSGFWETLFNACIPLTLLIPVFIWFDIGFSPLQALASLGIMVLILFGYGLGILLTPIGLLFQDIGRAIPFLSRFWFFLTPVIYPPPEQFPASLLVSINPISPLLSSTRSWLTGQPSDYLGPFVGVAVVTFFVLFVSMILYRLSMPHIVARMSA
jgi:lipopolysaccharide transport system permease protein